MNDSSHGFGLSQQYQQILIDIFASFLTTGEVIIYGSRVKGNYTNRSDVDLVLKNSHFNRHQLAQLIDTIAQSDFPYLCDIQCLETINNLSLLDHISRLGQVFYTASKDE